MFDACNGDQNEQGRLIREDVLPPKPMNSIREIPYSQPIKNVTPPLVEVDASGIAPSITGNLIDKEA
ncbi:MAG TPA: hypothetical protein VMR59_01615 [Patescibacteria group bacterium]|jgi:hypothetical protein|nr:hypothetical protein [Patescibacteria group bacterium]